MTKGQIMGFNIDIGMESAPATICNTESVVVATLEMNEAMAGLEHAWTDTVILQTVYNNISNSLTVAKNVSNVDISNMIMIGSANISMTPIDIPNNIVGVENIKSMISKVWEAIKKAAKKVWKWILKTIDMIVKYVQSLFGSTSSGGGGGGGNTFTPEADEIKIKKIEELQQQLVENAPDEHTATKLDLKIKVHEADSPEAQNIKEFMIRAACIYQDILPLYESGSIFNSIPTFLNGLTKDVDYMIEDIDDYLRDIDVSVYNTMPRLSSNITLLELIQTSRRLTLDNIESAKSKPVKVNTAALGEIQTSALGNEAIYVNNILKHLGKNEYAIINNEIDSGDYTTVAYTVFTIDGDEDLARMASVVESLSDPIDVIDKEKEIIELFTFVDSKLSKVKRNLIVIKSPIVEELLELTSSMSVNQLTVPDVKAINETTRKLLNKLTAKISNIKEQKHSVYDLANDNTPFSTTTPVELAAHDLYLKIKGTYLNSKMSLYKRAVTSLGHMIKKISSNGLHAAAHIDLDTIYNDVRRRYTVG